MTTMKRLGLVLGAALVLAAALGSGFPAIRGFPSAISKAEARVGRPLTPVSVAGVARRTARRCAVGVYNC
ncbi:hypothetical protein DLJ53_27505 [Acuticoccus sediminis]|uniref:Uncharacterized protein n=1 Tax=Acuticoccus sediminis TaxID=2184697 RepID=A0A8B2NJI5_9HYPH|nr:hypothetical protein [Acuticoccus sediminis]RAH98436.1 hypothetical protein DLJ53_27505 [Acuticoccus sediminis]